MQNMQHINIPTVYMLQPLAKKLTNVGVEISNMIQCSFLFVLVCNFGGFGVRHLGSSGCNPNKQK